MPPKKQKPIKSVESKNEEKNITIVDDVNKTDIDNTIDLDTEVEYDEVEFVKKTNYAEFDKNIKFNIYDQDNFQIETHKEIIIVADEKRKTSEIITKFEFTEVVSNRAKQIENVDAVVKATLAQRTTISQRQLRAVLRSNTHTHSRRTSVKDAYGPGSPAHTQVRPGPAAAPGGTRPSIFNATHIQCDPYSMLPIFNATHIQRDDGTRRAHALHATHLPTTTHCSNPHLPTGRQ